MIFSHGKAEKETKDLIFQHFDAVKGAIEYLNKMLSTIFDNTEHNAKECSMNIHKKEHEADILRRKILQIIEKGAFLPTMRGELLSFVEKVDGIADKVESVGDYYVLYSPLITEVEYQKLLNIGRISLEAFNKLVTAYKVLFTNFDETLVYCQEIEKLEEDVDKIEWDLKKALFEKKEEELAMKILKKDFVNSLCDISDRIEDASDILEIMVVKRKI